MSIVPIESHGELICMNHLNSQRIRQHHCWWTVVQWLVLLLHCNGGGLNLLVVWGFYGGAEGEESMSETMKAFHI